MSIWCHCVEKKVKSTDITWYMKLLSSNDNRKTWGPSKSEWSSGKRFAVLVIMTKDIRKNLLLKYFREFQVNTSYATNISEQKPVLSENKFWIPWWPSHYHLSHKKKLAFDVILGNYSKYEQCTWYFWAKVNFVWKKYSEFLPNLVFTASDV